MHKVRSTYRILVARVLQTDSIEEWIDWALEMMEAGFENEHIICLAGVSPNLNRFELDDIISRLLKDLSLDIISDDEKVHAYVAYLIEQALVGENSNIEVLRIVRDLCRTREYDNDLFDFYLLAYAKEDLEDTGVQFYWEGADKQNIDAIINNKFREWKRRYDSISKNCA